MEAAGVVDGYGFQAGAYGSQAQAGRFGAGEEYFVQSIQIPDGAGGGKAFFGEGYIDQRQVAIFTVNIDRQGFAVASNPFGKEAAGGDQAGGDAG